ncbi:filament-like plant protein 7 [Pistacia vera]|uniref:filament-like plant protein 7 n=1 Tax=Pistacia vera TaxID=55513 RepID=UPI001262D7E0|nr:filament-like plant protein 7 [Pistacia vera]
MDNKAWLWRKKSSEKTIVADKVDITLKRIDEEVQKLPTEKAVGPERSVKNLNEKLASVLLDCHPQDDLLRKHAKLAQEAVAGREKSEVETAFLKKELNEALRHGLATEEKLACSDTALMKCKQQLNFVQEEQEKRIHDAVMKTSNEFEKIRKELEHNLAEANKSLAKLAAENSHLSKALLVKEKQIEDLHKSKSQAEAEFNTLMTRLDATEKENAFLKYEFRILEKELEIRNDEMEYNRRSVDAAHKQHLESVKKIAKLEGECQRLRLLMRKKLPGPAALEKVKAEFKTVGRDQMEMKRRNLKPSRDLIVREAIMEFSPENFSNNSLLIERLRDIEEENKTLKETVTMKSTELQASRMMYSRTASRLSHVEAHLKELCKVQKPMELAICGPVSSELSIMPVHNASDDGISSSGSWANALISELEHFKAGKLKHQLEHKPIDVSDMSLMDDFVEMEKLAIVSLETAPGGGCQPDVTGKELVPVVQSHSNPTETKPEIHSEDIATEKSFDWLQVVLNAMLKQKHISKQSLNELLEDIRIALGFIKHPTVSEAESVAISRHTGELKALQISGDIALKSPNLSPTSHSLDADSGIDTLIKERSSQHLESNLIKSIRKIIKLIEGFTISSSVGYNASDSFSERDRSSLNLVTPVHYTVHVFQWRSSELSALLQKLVCTCNDLLNGKSDLEKFVGELSFALDWIINNSFAPKDAPTTRNKMKHFGWNEPEGENEVGAAVDGLLLESNTVHKSEEQSSCLVSASPLHDQNVSFQTERIQGNIQGENKRLKDEMRNIEARLESFTNKSKALMIQLRESEDNIGALKEEVKILKESKEMIEDQIENQKSINEDLDTQLTVAKAKLSEVFQKFSSLEVELEYKNNCCEELEATCLELQLQLESVAKKETPKYGTNQEGKRSQNGWEITAASVKLAECQETILNLGKQLKALASPREAVLFDNVFSSTNSATTTAINKKLNKRFSLRDQMIAEDGAKAEVVKSFHKKGTLSIEDVPKPSLLDSKDCNYLHDPNALVHTPDTYRDSKNKASNTAASSLAIVPSKKRGIGLLMKLLLRRKKGSSKKSKPLAMV